MSIATGRLYAAILLAAVSLGASALISSSYETLGFDGDPAHVTRVAVLSVLVLVCAALVATVVCARCSHCRSNYYRAFLQRELFDRLPYGGTGLRFTVVVAVIQSVCVGFIQIDDSVPSTGEDLIGWSTSLALVLFGTIVVRALLRVLPRAVHELAMFFVTVPRLRPRIPTIRMRRSRLIGGR